MPRGRARRRPRADRRHAVRRSGPAGGSGALPEGHALGIPTRFWPTARSGIVGVRGALGLARDAVLPRPDIRGPIGDRSIGPLVARKLGRRVVDTLVDPLIGGIHAGSVDDMSAAATFPPLLAAAQRRGGLMRALRAEVPPPDPDGPPLFWALDGGMAALVDTLVAGLRGARRGRAALGTGRPPRRATAGGWTVASAGQAVEADAVVLATPAPATAALLRPHDDEVAGLLDAIDYASVVLVTFRVGTGRSSRRRSTAPGSSCRAAARTRDASRGPSPPAPILDRKWPHLERRRGGAAPRLARTHRRHPRRAWSDDEVAERAWEELGALMGVGGQPADALVVRFPTRSRSTGCTTCCGRPASSRPWPVSVASPWPVRRTAASASPPASPAAGLRHTRSCERPAAPGPRGRPLGRGGCPARALAPPVGLVAPGAGGCGAALLAPGRPAPARPASGPAGWPGWAATSSGSSGPGPSTGTARSSSSSSRRCSSPRPRAPRRPDAGGRRPSWVRAPWPRPSA